MTLRRRIMVLTLGTLVAGMVLSGLAVGLAAWRADRATIGARLHGELLIVSRALSRGQTPVLPPGEGWRLVTLTATESGGAPLPPTPLHLDTLGVTSAHGFIWTRLQRRGSELVVAESTAAAVRPFWQLMAAIALVDALVLGAAVLMARPLADRALATLRRAARAAERLGGSGRPSGHLPGADSKDEVGVFVRAVNRLLDSLGAAFAELEMAREREQTFVADAGHDLKTPLTVIRGNLELMARPDQSEEGRSLALREAQSAVRRMSGLVDRLLEAARGELAQSVRRRPVDVGRLLAEVSDSFRAAAGRRLLSVAGEMDLVVPGDPEELRRALDVLVDNAIRYTDEREGQITLGCREQGPWCELTVSDNGPGIPKEWQQRVFERFARLDPSRQDGGIGLGLAIARAIARAHDGDLTVESEEGGGSRFILRLPMRSGDAPGAISRLSAD